MEPEKLPPVKGLNFSRISSQTLLVAPLASVGAKLNFVLSTVLFRQAYDELLVWYMCDVFVLQTSSSSRRLFLLSIAGFFVADVERGSLHGPKMRPEENKLCKIPAGSAVSLRSFRGSGQLVFQVGRNDLALSHFS